MSESHWDNLKEIFHAVVALPESARPAYLEKVCDGDQSLRVAVESLIKSHEETNNFVDAPAYRAAAELLIGNGFESGHTIAHYQVRSVLGEGGMGKVYLAQDTKLDRKVGLKILPPQLVGDQERLRRFAQEAKAAAALNHPNIAQIYEIGEHNHTRYIAMEYVEGETLREVALRRRLDIKRAVELAAQVASGLAAAHKAGVVHRDIKPDNLMVLEGDRIKILDFGLAKITERQDYASGASELTTAYVESIPQHQTKPGVIMGTVSYMSPEQARADKVDQRTDIFSLGVVLYEMVTGERPFKGKSEIETLNAIINLEPPAPTSLNAQLPPELVEILKNALAKDPAERYQHAGDLELDLRRFKRAFESNRLISKAHVATVPAKQLSGPLVWLVAGALLLCGVAIGALLLKRPSFSSSSAIKLENVTLTPFSSDPGYEGEPTFSPDGQTIAYVSDRSGNLEIYLRQISGGADINLTNNNKDDVQPAFSPDGKQIAFVSTRTSKSDLIYRAPGTPLMGGDIWVMPALGGSPRRIVEEGNYPSWSADSKTILYSAGRWGNYKILSVSATGGPSHEIPISFKAGETTPLFLHYPSYSPDGHWILFQAQNDVIYVVPADGGEAQQLARGRCPVWTANAEAVVFSNAEPGKNLSLWLVPFASAEGKASGSPEPLTVGRGRDTQAAVSADMKLIAFATQDVSFNIESVPFDAEAGRMSGTPQQLTAGDNRYYFFDVSPDGRSIVTEAHRGASYSIWRIDSSVVPVELTSDRNFEDRSPKWSPDGSQIAFTRRMIPTQSRNSLWLMAADGANPQLLFEPTGGFSWTPDGRAIVYYSTDRQLYEFDLGSKKNRQITNEPDVMQKFSISHDSKWLIYQSTWQSSDPDIRAIPLGGGSSQTVAATAGEDYHPFLSPSGNWLYFQPNHKNLYRVPGPTQNWRTANPEKVTDFPESNLFLEDPQISRDGQRLFFSRERITSDIWIMSLNN